MTKSDKWKEKYHRTIALPPEDIISQLKEENKKARKSFHQGRRERLAIGAGLASKLCSNLEEIERLREERVFRTRGQVTPYTLVMEAFLGASESNSRNLAWRWARIAEYLVEEEGIHPLDIPQEIKDRGGIGALVKEAERQTPRAPRKNKDSGTSTFSVSGLLKPIKGSKDALITVRLKGRALGHMKQVDDHWSVRLRIERVPGLPYFEATDAREADPPERPRLTPEEARELREDRQRQQREREERNHETRKLIRRRASR